MNKLAIRGSILHFLDDPTADDNTDTWQYIEDGLLMAEAGYITRLGEAQQLLADLPNDTTIIDHSGKLILPGFVDTHVHSVQTDIIASHGKQLLEWLEEYTFPAESAFADAAHAKKISEFFLDQLLSNGTTTAMVLGSVHPGSADAVFEGARTRGMRVIVGKTLMDRNCPAALRDTAESGYEESKTLIEKWHNKDRLGYAVTPRFAPTSTPEQLERAGALLREYPDVHMQTHLAETANEIAWVKKLFPERRSYLDVYHHYGLLGSRSVMAHGIWLDDDDLALMAETGTSISHCPTCNLFMGSGLFDYKRTRSAGTHVSLGTDIGGGTSFSMLAVMHDAYKVARMNEQSITALQAFYLATLAGARALGLDDKIGNFESGKEADIVVLDPKATLLLARRGGLAQSLSELLFAVMMLGDDRAVTATYLMGEPVSL